MANQVAILAAMKVVADAGKDAVSALKSGESWSQRVAGVSNNDQDFSMVCMGPR